MPGEKSLELQEYYGNRGNQFWKLLFSMFNLPLSHNYNDKLQLLKDYDIAVWDVLEYCEREGSLDSKIKNEKANDFLAFYKEYPCVKYVFFSNKKAEVYYDKHIGKNDTISYNTLSSPSGANATKSFKEKLDLSRHKISPELSLSIAPHRYYNKRLGF